MVVITAVTASEVTRMVSGNVPVFMVPTYALVSLWEFPLYAVLGFAAALVGMVFTVMLYALQDAFGVWTLPAHLRLMVGGLFVGAIGLVFPQVFGVGYDTMAQALNNELPLRSRTGLKRDGEV